jgi:RimJ/RimL family protein N-acetyltransferase
VVRWGGTVVLVTPRLSLRTFREDDLPLYAELNADPVVTRFLGGPLSSEDSDGIAEWAQELYDREGIGLLAVERREDGAFLGMFGLHHFHAYPTTSRSASASRASTGVTGTAPRRPPRGSITVSGPWGSRG